VEAPSNASALGEVRVEEADDGHSAVQAIQSDADFDLVLIDCIMTTMNGPEAVQIMRGDLKFAGAIIGVTGNALPSDLTFFQQSGADAVITKPLTNKKLMDAILIVKRRNSMV
jgi:CheY-like chemotaxis protein